MRVLVTVASKHGATAEIGDIVGVMLTRAGFQVDTLPPEAVPTPMDYDAVVVGSAVYAGRWLESARTFVEKQAAELTSRPLWLFSSGPIGDPPVPAGQPAEPVEIANRLGAREHRTFTGRLERRGLGLLERTITRALGAPNGDFRDFEDVRAWAAGIASALTREAVAA